MTNYGVGVNCRLKPAIRWFRCPGCGVTYPESRWTPAESARYLREGRATRCDGCSEERIGDEERAGFCWEGE